MSHAVCAPFGRRTVYAKIHVFCLWCNTDHDNVSQLSLHCVLRTEHVIRNGLSYVPFLIDVAECVRLSSFRYCQNLRNYHQLYEATIGHAVPTIPACGRCVESIALWMLVNSTCSDCYQNQFIAWKNMNTNIGSVLWAVSLTKTVSWSRLGSLTILSRMVRWIFRVYSGCPTVCWICCRVICLHFICDDVLSAARTKKLQVVCPFALMCFTKLQGFFTFQVHPSVFPRNHPSMSSHIPTLSL